MNSKQARDMLQSLADEGHDPGALHRAFNVGASYAENAVGQQLEMAVALLDQGEPELAARWLYSILGRLDGYNGIGKAAGHAYAHGVHGSVPPICQEIPAPLAKPKRRKRWFARR
jgi:hypothetical protein